MRRYHVLLDSLKCSFVMFFAYSRLATYAYKYSSHSSSTLLIAVIALTSTLSPELGTADSNTNIFIARKPHPLDVTKSSALLHPPPPVNRQHPLLSIKSIYRILSSNCNKSPPYFFWIINCSDRFTRTSMIAVT